MKNSPYFFIKSMAPIGGAVMALIALVSGGLFGGNLPWGTWWIWDARLKSVLVTCFFISIWGYCTAKNA